MLHDRDPSRQQGRVHGAGLAAGVAMLTESMPTSPACCSTSQSAAPAVRNGLPVP
jgi:hypothetical protein